jgi:predicted O-methyltransferase YrrM
MKYRDFEIAQRVWKKASSVWNEIRYERCFSLESIRATERRKFAELGFQYDDSLIRLNSFLRKLGRPDFNSQDSIHLLLFSCIGLSANITNILEIGTYLGESTVLLSQIFPNSSITTVDLPDDDPILAATYGRNNAAAMREYREQQHRNVSRPGVNFLQKNSFFVPAALEKKFDLIWIDGGHLYPEIAWDICNAYHLCIRTGWILCDDVIPHKRGYRSELSSPDSFKVLEYVSRRTADKVTYFLKT